MAGFVQKFKDMISPPDDAFGGDNFEESFEDMDLMDSGDDIDNNYYNQASPREVARASAQTSYQRDNKVVNINATTQLQVVLSKPTQFGDETRAVADELLKMHTVVLNLENTNKDVSRRMLDFLSGVAYANNGKIKRIATSTFIITPYNVDLTGDDLIDELENNGLSF